MALAGLALLGCEPRPGTRTPADGAVAATPRSDQAAVWPFWPVRLRVHPLTRITTDGDGRTIVEARIEYFDVHGATTKAVGQLVLELLDATQPLDRAETIQLWNQDLRNPNVNQRQYDVVTRTYLFRLEIDPAKFPPQPLLHAYFVSTDGQKLEASSRLQP